jgi:hypothetical protein
MKSSSLSEKNDRELCIKKHISYLQGDKIKNAWLCASTFSRTFTAWCLMEHYANLLNYCGTTELLICRSEINMIHVAKLKYCLS